MLCVTIPKDHTTALVKMGLKETGKTAQVRFCLRHNGKELTERKIHFDLFIYVLLS